jgi:hypothetical protein
MSAENPILDATAVSVIVNRKDKPGQVPWTEWRNYIVLTGGTPAQAGDLVILGPNGQFDPSVIPGGGGGSTVYVNEAPVANPDFNNGIPAPPVASGRNVTWQVSGSQVSAYLDVAGTFSLDDGTFLNPDSDFMFDDGGFA